MTCFDSFSSEKDELQMRVRQIVSGLVAAAFLFIPRPLLAQIQLTPVVSGLASPVFVGNAGDGSNRLFIVEQA